jgi:hypothetical protein
VLIQALLLVYQLGECFLPIIFYISFLMYLFYRSNRNLLCLHLTLTTKSNGQVRAVNIHMLGALR